MMTMKMEMAASRITKVSGDRCAIGLENIQILPLSFVHGIQDKEKEGWLKQVEQLYQEGMLGLLVPEGRQVSEKTAALAAAAFS